MRQLDALPPEIIQRIANRVSNPSDLYNCTLINRTFYTITNPYLWRTINIEDQASFSRFISSLVLSATFQPPRVPSLGQHIRHLFLYQPITDPYLLLLMPHVPHLDTLSLVDNSPQLTDISFQHLPRFCPYLKCLELADSVITPTTLVSVCQQLPRLCALHLLGTVGNGNGGDGGQLPSDFFTLLSDHCRDLKDIWLEQSRHWVTQQTMVDLTRYRELTELVLDVLPDGFDYNALMAAIGGLVPWPKLDFFVIGDVEDAFMIQFIQQHPRLEFLLLSGNTFTNQTLDAIATHLSGTLVALAVYDNHQITTNAIRRLVQQCGHQLALVNLEACAQIIVSRGFPEIGVDVDHATTILDLDYDAIRRLRLVLPPPPPPAAAAAEAAEATDTTETTTSEMAGTSEVTATINKDSMQL